MLYSVSSVVSDSLLSTPWNVAHQAPLSRGFSRQEYWRGLPRPPPTEFHNPGIEPISLFFEPMSLMSPALQADSLQSEPLGKPGELQIKTTVRCNAHLSE